MMNQEQFAQAAVAGMQVVAGVVSAGYGPVGRSILIDRAAGLLSTRDGVTVAREVVLADAMQQAGAALIVEAALKTNAQAGDATSATVLIAAAAAAEALRLIQGGIHPGIISRSAAAALSRATEAIRSEARELDGFAELEQVALISAGGDAGIASALRDAITMVGQDGTVTVESSMETDLRVVLEEGTSFQTTLASADFLPEGGERILLEPLVAVVLGTLRTTADVVPMLELASKIPGHPLLVLAEDCSGEALKTLLLNDRRGDIRVVAARPPGIGDWKRRFLGDMAVLAGADLIDPVRGQDPRSWEVGWFGIADRAAVTRNRLVLHSKDGVGDAVESRRTEIALEMEMSGHDYDRDRHAERIAGLGGSLCIVKVGGTTEAEARARRSVVEDALCACRGALSDGVIFGGGTAYLLAAEVISGIQSPGAAVVRAGLRAPFRALCARSGLNPARATAEVIDKLERGEDPRPGVIDSVKAAIAAAENGISAALMGACAGYFVPQKAQQR